jgi:hypothetical protein
MAGGMECELAMPAWAAQRLRTGCKSKKRSLQLAEKAANQNRTGGRFVKSKSDIPALGYRSPLERAQSVAEALRERNAKLQADHNTNMAAQTAEHLLAMQKLLDELNTKNRDLRTLSKKLRAVAPATTTPKRPNRKILNGSTRQTRHKPAVQLKSHLSSTFSPEARKQALFEHAQQHPTDCSSIINQGASLPAFQDLCK